MSERTGDDLTAALARIRGIEDKARRARSIQARAALFTPLAQDAIEVGQYALVIFGGTRSICAENERLRNRVRELERERDGGADRDESEMLV